MKKSINSNFCIFIQYLCILHCLLEFDYFYMLTHTIFHRKKVSKSRSKDNKITKDAFKNILNTPKMHLDSPCCSIFWDQKSVTSQRNTTNKQTTKNEIPQKKLIKRGSHRHHKSNLTATNSMFMTCNVTPRGMSIKKNETVNPRSRYKFIYQIGFGGFGKVWKIQEKRTGKVYAMKEISKQKVVAKKSIDSVLNERKILSVLSNNFLINMNRSFQDQENLYMVMDYLRGADLRYHICYKIKFTEEQTKFIIACIIQGLQYIHESNIIHRDIKPQNIVFQENGYARITDFGIANIKATNKATVMTNETSGTPGYMAPQILCKREYGFSSDFFAIGVITYQLMLGKRPYQGNNRKQIREQIINFQAMIRQNNIPKGWSIHTVDFINRLLQRVPQQRLGHQSIKQIKDHPWMKSIKWAKLQKKKLIPPFTPNVVCQTREYLQQIMVYNELNDENRQNYPQLTSQQHKQFDKYDYQKVAYPKKTLVKKASDFSGMLNIGQYGLKKIKRSSQQRIKF